MTNRGVPGAPQRKRPPPPANNFTRPSRIQPKRFRLRTARPRKTPCASPLPSVPPCMAPNFPCPANAAAKISHRSIGHPCPVKRRASFSGQQKSTACAMPVLPACSVVCEKHAPHLPKISLWVPVRVSVSTSTSSSMQYTSSQSGCTWHSLYPAHSPVSA